MNIILSSASKVSPSLRISTVSRCYMLLFCIGMFFLLSSCSTSYSSPDFTETEGKTSILLADTILEDCYSYVVDQTGSPAEWIQLDIHPELEKGDIVLLLSRANDYSRVMIPYTDTPGIYGYLPSEQLSTEPGDIKSGNQAIANGTAYQTNHPTSAAKLSCFVQILEKQDKWFKVTPCVGGDSNTYWINSMYLSFNFNSVIPDNFDEQTKTIP